MQVPSPRKRRYMSLYEVFVIVILILLTAAVIGICLVLIDLDNLLRIIIGPGALK